MKLEESDIRLRYARQIAVPEIGKRGQTKLLESKVLVIGAGALGSMVAMQLAGAGVGTIGICDFDKVDISNLQRQFFFTTSEAGESKVDLLSQRLAGLNPDSDVRVYKEFMTPHKAENIFPEYDFIVDATDNPESKKMTGELCGIIGKACNIAGVREFSGQVTTLLPTDARFEDYFGAASGAGVLPCSLGGVIGPAAALCASLQSSETIKCLLSTGSLLSGKLLYFNLLTNSFQIFRL